MTTVTQDNLYLLIPTKIRWLAPWLAEDKGMSREKEATKYWHLGLVDLYRELIEEV